MWLSLSPITAPKYLDFKLSKEAARYYKSGPSLLMRYFPFWVANFISRMKVLLLPLIVLLFPLVKMMPPHTVGECAHESIAGMQNWRPSMPK